MMPSRNPSGRERSWRAPEGDAVSSKPEAIGLMTHAKRPRARHHVKPFNIA